MKIKGSVEYKKLESDKEWNVVKNGQMLSEGAIINTKENSSCELKIDEAKSLFLSSNTQIEIKQAINNVKAKKINASIEHKIGTICGKLALTNGENITVKTPSTVMGIRGTTFVIKTNDGSSTVIASEGTVYVKRNIQLSNISDDKKAKIEEMLNKEQLVTKNKKVIISKKDNEDISKACLNPKADLNALNVKIEAKLEELVPKEIAEVEEMVNSINSNEKEAPVKDNKDAVKTEPDKSSTKLVTPGSKPEPKVEPKKEIVQKPYTVIAPGTIEPENVKPFEVIGVRSNSDLGSGYKKQLMGSVIIPGSGADITGYNEKNKLVFIDIPFKDNKVPFIKASSVTQYGTPSVESVVNKRVEVEEVSEETDEDTTTESSTDKSGY